jgi:hypothetical protein
MAFALPPAASPLVVPITFSVDLAPYVTRWYTDNRLVGETPSEFLARMIGPSVVDYVASRDLAVAQSSFTAVQAANAAERASVKQALGF